MKPLAALLYFILAIALTGVPFGMGRMMDGGNHTRQASTLVIDHSAMGPMKHGDAPAHDPSTLHFVLCAACFAAPVVAAPPPERIAFRQAVAAIAALKLHGKSLLPDLPPPRA